MPVPSPLSQQAYQSCTEPYVTTGTNGILYRSDQARASTRRVPGLPENSGVPPSTFVLDCTCAMKGTGSNRNRTKEKSTKQHQNTEIKRHWNLVSSNTMCTKWDFHKKLWSWIRTSRPRMNQEKPHRLNHPLRTLTKDVPPYKYTLEWRCSSKWMHKFLWVCPPLPQLMHTISRVRSLVLETSLLGLLQLCCLPLKVSSPDFPTHQWRCILISTNINEIEPLINAYFTEDMPQLT